MISSESKPAARLSRMVATKTRVPAMQALPWQISGSTVMCSRQFSDVFSPVHWPVLPFLFLVRENGLSSNKMAFAKPRPKGKTIGEIGGRRRNGQW